MDLNKKLDHYNVNKLEFSKKAINTQSEKCSELLSEFLKQFNDGHLFVFERPKYSEEEVNIYKKYVKSKLKDPKTMNELISIQRDLKQNTIEGKIVGKYTDGKSKIGIIKEKGNYNAYILETVEENVEVGELKASLKYDNNEYSGTYYNYNHEPRFIQGTLFKEGTILSMTMVLWAKIESDFKREVEMLNVDDPNMPTIQKIDEKNTLFSIPTFSTPYQSFAELVKNNYSILENSENIIFDIRGNRGGNAVYFSFIELYATEAVLKSTQGQTFASEDTKIYYERMRQHSEEIYGTVVKEIENNMGKIISGPKYSDQQLELHPSKIKNVAILTDGAVGSAAETFILHSKQVSSKVTTFGSPTYGMIDQTSVNSIILKTSKDLNIYFGYPTSSLGGNDERHPNGYNKTGILPDISIKDSVKDKVQFVMDYYKNNY